MSHPLIPQITELAKPIALELNLEIVNIVFQTNKNPPVLRVDIKSTVGDTGLNDCEQMSRLLDEILETKEIIPFTYVLEISSPGIGVNLQCDREFISFKGFPVTVTTNTLFKKKTQWEGTLQGRDDTSVLLNCKGKIIPIPREIITQVQLQNP